MNYAEAIQFLSSLRVFGTTFGLENTLKLAALAGHPENQLRFIHVAGTNGKGSTCAMIESIYRAAGLRTGLFTSPHLVAFGERIQVNRQRIPDADLVRLVSEIQPQLKIFPPNGHPTFFEIVTIMALRFFAEQKCDLVVWETGLGGRLDATNIVTPMASVITPIAFDHQQWLGDTLEKIAVEKAGIIKPGVPVVVGATQPPEALCVIRDVARQQHSPLTVVDEAAADGPLLNAIKLSLPGRHQKHNAALALATVRCLDDSIPVSEKDVRCGLEQVEWPGRFQVVQISAAQTMVLDGAHNPAAVEVLKTALKTDFPGVRPTLVFGVLRDKDWKSIITQLAALAGRWVLLPVKSERTLDPAELRTFCEQANSSAPVTVAASLAEALDRTRRDPLVVVTGSLYLVGEAMELLGLSATPAINERGLNDWGASTVVR
jgi:dihydrofolate synthase/folylpolyglutamate synthase